MSKSLYKDSGQLVPYGKKIGLRIENFLDKLVRDVDRANYNLQELEVLLHRRVSVPILLIQLYKLANKKEKKNANK